MRTIRVERRIAAPIEQVFEVLSDHAQYARFPGIRRAELISPGRAERNGLGAIRRVLIGPLRFEEEITAFERPTRLDYLIVKINAPFRHQGGSIRLEDAGDGTTDALWTSVYEIPVPLLGPVLERLFANRFGNGFDDVLSTTEELAAEPVPAAT